MNIKQIVIGAEGNVLGLTETNDVYELTVCSRRKVVRVNEAQQYETTRTSYWTLLATPDSTQESPHIVDVTTNPYYLAPCQHPTNS